MRDKPTYAVYQRWPQIGIQWIHHEDVNTVRKLIPSRQLFRREPDDGAYTVFSYGERQFRVLPSMHLAVDGEGLDVGDQIEVKSQVGRNRPFVGRIREMRWNDRYRRIEYYFTRSQRRVPRWYSLDELQCLENKERVRQSDS